MWKKIRCDNVAVVKTYTYTGCFKGFICQNKANNLRERVRKIFVLEIHYVKLKNTNLLIQRNPHKIF